MPELLAVPLLFALLSSAPAIAQPAPEDWDTVGARHLELTADNAGQEHPVRVSPHHPTNLVFNAHSLVSTRTTGCLPIPSAKPGTVT